MFSPLGSDPPKVFLLFYQSYNTLSIFRVCFGLPKYFSTSDESPIFAVSNFVFLLSWFYRQPWKLITNLFGCCSRTVSVLLLFVLLSIICSEITHQLGLDLTPSLMSKEPSSNGYYYYYLMYDYLKSTNVNNITSRCK